MAEQYLRNVSVEFEGGKSFLYRGDENGGQGLRIRFRSQQKDVSTPNLLRVDIFNLAPTTVASLMMTGRQISLSAGYHGGPEYLLFKGQTRQVRANMRDDVSDPDSYLSILATDSGAARNYAIVNKSMPAGHTFYDRVMLCADAFKEMSVSIGYIDKEQLSKTKFPRGFAAFGMAKSLFREVCFATKTSWSIQNGVFQVVANDKAKPGAVVELNAKTGLIGQAVQTIGGIEGRSLINGMIVPTALVRIDNKSIQQAEIDPSIGGDPNNRLLAQYGALSADGTYKVFYVGHEGDTRGSSFYTDFVAVTTASKTVPPVYASRGISLPNY